MQDRRHGDGDREAMMARCSICRRFYAPGKSRTLCDRDYWRIRRLREKTPEQLRQLERETEVTRACIAAALHASDDTGGVVAPSQRGDG